MRSFGPEEWKKGRSVWQRLLKRLPSESGNYCVSDDKAGPDIITRCRSLPEARAWIALTLIYVVRSRLPNHGCSSPRFAQKRGQDGCTPKRLTDGLRRPEGGGKKELVPLMIPVADSGIPALILSPAVRLTRILRVVFPNGALTGKARSTCSSALP